MTKPIIELSINLVGGGDAITVSDSTKPGVAGAVLAALERGRDIHYNDGEAEYFIPFHSILIVEISRSSEEVEKPADSLCVEVTESAPADPEEP